MVEQSSYPFGLCHVSGEVITLDFSGNLLSILFVARVNEHLGCLPARTPGQWPSRCCLWSPSPMRLCLEATSSSPKYFCSLYYRNRSPQAILRSALAEF